MDVLGAKHLRVNQLPPAELKELKVCPVFLHVPLFSPSYFPVRLTAHWLAGKSVKDNVTAKSNSIVENDKNHILFVGNQWQMLT